MLPYVREWLKHHSTEARELVEPFAGSAIVSLTALSENLIERATMVERDENVAAVWRTILSQEAKWLADRIVGFEVTEAAVKKILAENSLPSMRERAFITIVKNRVNRGGILAPGAGMLKHGENGKGISSRWYPQTLKNRIHAIALLKDRIRFIEGNGLEVMAANARRKDAVYFIDPPYTKAGKRLYKYSELDHEALFEMTASCSGDFLMTYDDANEIRSLAKRHHLQIRPVGMKSNHHQRKIELLIGRNLSWLKDV